MTDDLFRATPEQIRFFEEGAKPFFYGGAIRSARRPLSEAQFRAGIEAIKRQTLQPDYILTSMATIEAAHRQAMVLEAATGYAEDELLSTPPLAMAPASGPAEADR